MRDLARHAPHHARCFVLRDDTAAGGHDIARARVPSDPMPVRTRARIHDPQTAAAEENNGSTAGLQKLTMRPVVERDHRLAVAPDDPHVPAARAT